MMDNSNLNLERFSPLRSEWPTISSVFVTLKGLVHNLLTHKKQSQNFSLEFDKLFIYTVKFSDITVFMKVALLISTLYKKCNF